MRAWTRLTLGCLLAAAMTVPALAYTTDEDISFASGLITFKPSFKDFAQTLVDQIRERDPSSADRLKVIQAELFVENRKYDEAEKLVQELGVQNPKAQAIMLTLAVGYYNAGEQDKSVKLFDDFFNQYKDGAMPTDADVLRFYQRAALQYAQIREHMGDYKSAAECYKRAQDSSSIKEQQRDLLLKQAQAWIKTAENSNGPDRDAALEQAEKICHEIFWGGLDIAFVNAVVVLANAKIIRGDAAGARDTINDYMENIKQVDGMLEEYGMNINESPLGGARSLLGRLYKQEADSVADNASEAIPLYSKALTEYYNVFVKYGQGPYGGQAGMEAKAIKEILETKYGKTVKIELPDTLQAKAAGTEFAMADQLFKRKEYAQARDEYLRVLSQFPESGDLSVGALAYLLQCYINLDDKLMAQTVAHYIGERFGRKTDMAGNAIRAAAGIYRRMDPPDSPVGEDATRFFEIYLQNCPNHPNVGETLYFLGGMAAKYDDTENANRYFNRIITDYPTVKQYPLALSRQAWGAYAAHDYAGAIQGLRLYIKDTDGEASPLRANAMFALADCLRRTSADANKAAETANKAAEDAKASAQELMKAGDKEGAVAVAATYKKEKEAATEALATSEANFKEALQQFQALVKALAERPDDFAKSQADKDKNQTLLQQANFWLAYTISQKPDPKFQGLAVRQLAKFTEDYPTSELNPKALKLKGSLQLALKDPAANETFDTLAKKYPDTDEGKNAQYARISGALELGLHDQAAEAANAMAASPSSYSLDQFARVGSLLLEHGLWPEAQKTYAIVRDRLGEVATEQRRRYEEPALYGLGKADYEIKDFDGAQAALAELMEKYPKSGLFFKAQYVLGQAALARNDLDAATKALNDILRYATENEVVNDASILLAQVQIKQDKPIDALSTYKRLEFLNSLNMKTDREREQIKTALVQAIELEENISDDTSLLETLDRYLELFPTDPRASELSGKRARARQRLEEAAAGAAEPAAAE